MKKRWIALLAALALLLLGSACGQEGGADKAASAEAESTSATTEAEQASGRTLVAVFSGAANAAASEETDAVSAATLNAASGLGAAQIMGRTAVEATGGDYFEIVCATPYPATEEETYAQSKEEQLQQARPKLASKVANMEDYSTVVLVYPNWWGGLPMPVCTFLEAYDFGGKTIVPVCCYKAEDSGFGSSLEEIGALCQGRLGSGYAVRGSAASTHGTAADFTTWLQELAL